MPTSLTLYDAHLDTLFTAQLLCSVCAERPWSQMARWHAALVCADCASGEPEEEGS